jgi:catechol 2,3-dioxygenase-like lactoylglutathione lyase family enzyme
MLNHLAYVTPDSQATAEFYTRVMGMELVNAVMDDRIPSTGEAFPYLHTFFRLGDGSTIAFFESPGLPARPPVSHPAYVIFDHLAFQVDSAQAVRGWKEWLVSNGVEVLGPVDHGILLSIYFFDTINNLRLEITTPLVTDWNDRGEDAQRDLEAWIEAKRRAAAEGRDVSAEICATISHRRAAAGGAQPS